MNHRNNISPFLSMSSPSQSTPSDAKLAELHSLKKTLLLPQMHKLLVHFKELFQSKASIVQMKIVFPSITWSSQAEKEEKARQIQLADIRVVSGLKLNCNQFREMAVLVLGEDVVKKHLQINSEEPYPIQNMETVLNLVKEFCRTP
jgi:hypothetical protein